MIQPDKAKIAAQELLAAAMLGDVWEDALQQLADATGAGGATLMRLRRGHPLAALSSSAWVEADAAMLAGRAPPSPRRFYPDHIFRRGFCGDTDIWADEELRRDAYFQEFLRPRGVFYHAKARLLADADERISLSLKRSAKFGPYEPADIAFLDHLIPELEMAVRIARRVLDAEAAGMTRVLSNRGDPVFELDAWGRVLRVHDPDSEDLGIVVRERRIVAEDPQAQAFLDRAVGAAVRAPQRPAIVTISNQRGERRFLHIAPVTGRAREVFLATAAVVVIVGSGCAKATFPTTQIRSALGLTEREAQIGALLGEGLSLPNIADHLHLGLGTLRNHLKSIFGKTGTRRQGELIALLRKIRF